MQPRLSGKHAVVTGAARGIGLAIAQAFLAQGASVLLTDIDVEAGAEAAGRLGRGAAFRRLDVRSETDWAELAADGGFNILVNNAGISGFGSGWGPQDPEHASLTDWHAVLATNLDGVFLGCRAAIRVMRANPAGGAILNLASRSGQVGIPGAAAYAASKAAIRNHTRTVALYCAEQGLAIRCNAISPAAIWTPIWEDLLPQDEPERSAAIAAFVADTPARRFGTVEEVAALAVLLASDECRYMTGAELTVDGGLLAGSVAAPADPSQGKQQGGE